MAYTTHNTVNNGRRNKPIHRAWSDSARKTRISLVKCIAFSKQSYGASVEKCRRANMIPVIRIYQYLLYLQTVLITAGTGVTISNVSKQCVNIIFCPSKANTWRLKNISCNRNEPKQYTNTWQITEVSNSTKRHAYNSGNHADLWPLKICHSMI